LARDIINSNGGLLTEFRSGSRPDKHNFPSRNRIVAGMSDATIVIETDIKGGSMITADLANGYNRDVFAFPGRPGDSKSAGCNDLIKNNKAILLTDTQQLLVTMGWLVNPSMKKNVQRELFIELSTEERTIVQLIQEKESIHIDEINGRSGLSGSAVAAAILNLELENVIVSLPGKMFRLA
jgi:DNA processing protein